MDAVNIDSVVEWVIDNVLENLDSRFTNISKQEIVSLNENMKTGFIVIVVRFYDYKYMISIIRAIKGRQSFCAEIKSAYRILMAENNTVEGSFWSRKK